MLLTFWTVKVIKENDFILHKTPQLFSKIQNPMFQNSRNITWDAHIQASHITQKANVITNPGGSIDQHSTCVNYIIISPTQTSMPFFAVRFSSFLFIYMSILRPPVWNVKSKGFPQGTWLPKWPSLFLERPNQQHQQGLRSYPGHHSGNRPDIPAATAGDGWMGWKWLEVVVVCHGSFKVNRSAAFWHPKTHHWTYWKLIQVPSKNRIWRRDSWPGAGHETAADLCQSLAGSVGVPYSTIDIYIYLFCGGPFSKPK